MDYYSFNRSRRDGRLSWPCWLTDSRRFTHKVVTRPAVSLAQDRESSPARTGGLTTMLRHQPLYLPSPLASILPPPASLILASIFLQCGPLYTSVVCVLFRNASVFSSCVNTINCSQSTNYILVFDYITVKRHAELHQNVCADNIRKGRSPYLYNRSLAECHY